MFNLLILSILVTCQSSIYQYSFTGINNENIDLNDYRGKHILFVNIATQSRYAPQLQKLEELYQKHKDSLVVIAFPSNDFGHEPNIGAELKSAITTRYPIHFLVASKTSVTGTGMHPVFKWLTQQAQNGVIDSPVENDFYKFLVNKDGQLIGVFSGFIDPLAADLENAITQSPL